MCLTVRGLSHGEGCAKCEEEYCPKAQEECRHGVGHDPCGCCPDGVCVLAEREKCFDGGYGYSIAESGVRKYGTCGELMECVSRTDLGPNDPPESLCICKHTETVCGSDNRTYDSVCEMKAEKADLRHYGPCLTKPAITTGPQATNTYEGANFALDCEAKGYPVPTVTWEFQSFSGPMATLPGGYT
ncbi:UNVERIFIED_CONTAM: hypothetical protein PYX00_007773 [Menopon gallinae]|uniref:Uncharacterized protein n=1 Tax=Menopon gallinae TaxID=328185 RepID=A0AAW2HKN3_9NEOP